MELQKIFLKKRTPGRYRGGSTLNQHPTYVSIKTKCFEPFSEYIK